MTALGAAERATQGGVGMTDRCARRFLFVPGTGPWLVDGARPSAAEAIGFALDDSVVNDDEAAA